MRDQHPVPEVCRKGIAVAAAVATTTTADERRRLYLNRRGLIGVAVSTDALRKTRTRSRTERPDNPRDLFLPRVSPPPQPLLRRCVGVQHAAPPFVSPTRISRRQKVGVKERRLTQRTYRQGGETQGVVIRAGSDREKGLARYRVSDSFRSHASD